MAGHPYCPHDEGETCYCHIELVTRHIDETPYRDNIPPLDKQSRASRAVQPPSEPVTQRRAEVKRLLRQKFTARAIAQQTGMHVRTVERHMAKIKNGEIPV